MSNNTAKKIAILTLVVLSFSFHVFATERTEKLDQELVAHGLSAPKEGRSFEQFVQEFVNSRQEIESFIRHPGWSKFDPEMGYIQGDYRTPGGTLLSGIDNSATISTLQPSGARTSFLYSNRKPRINTYGDSFTQGNQVNDGETWQEYLAGHLAEPIGNFGVGGYGVYQAYRRMIREEKTEHGAKYLILTICCDDSGRSIRRNDGILNKWAFGPKTLSSIGLFQGFWPDLEMDIKTGHFSERDNLLPTTESLYSMADPQWMVDHLKDDLALQLTLYSLGQIRDLNHEQINRLAALLGFSFDWSRGSTRDQAAALLDVYSSQATIYILAKARDFADRNGKKLLVVLNDPSRALPDMVEGRPRYDQSIVNYLVKEKFDYFDMNEVYLRKFKECNCKMSLVEYMKQFLVVNGGMMGHYSGSGNNFLAYSIKDKVVEWLNPKPENY